MFNINLILIINLFILFKSFIIYSLPTPTISLLPYNNNNSPSLPIINLINEEENEEQKLLFYKIIERSTNSLTDSILLKKEFCKKSCNEIIGEKEFNNELIINKQINCICNCPINEPIFVNTKEEGKCYFKINDCIGHPLKFQQYNLTSIISSQYVPIFNLLNNEEEEQKPLDFNLNINWKENGIKMRSNGGPKCLIETIYFLGNNSKWKEISKNKQIFKLKESEENKTFKGNLLWLGNDKEIKELSGGIVRIELNCATKNNGGINDNFCLTFRIEGQLG